MPSFFKGMQSGAIAVTATLSVKNVFEYAFSEELLSEEQLRMMGCFSGLVTINKWSAPSSIGGRLFGGYTTVLLTLAIQEYLNFPQTGSAALAGTIVFGVAAVTEHLLDAFFPAQVPALGAR